MKVLTPVVNNPRFIELQFHTLARYMRCPYEFVVFNDAKPFADFTNGGDITMRTQITDICTKLGIQCINIPNDSHIINKDAAWRCADSFNFMMKYMLDNPDKYLCIDSDMFLIDEYDPVTHYEGKSAGVVLQSRHNNSIAYIWNGLFYFDIPKMKNHALLNWNPKHLCDVGGMMEEWIRAETENRLPLTDELRWKSDLDCDTEVVHFIRHLWSTTWDMSELPDNLKDRVYLRSFLMSDPRNMRGKFFAEIYDKCFLHYRAGGNWRKEGMGLHIALTEQLFAAIMKDASGE